MNDDVIIDGTLFFRARRAQRRPGRREPAVYRAIWLDDAVSVGELIQALKFSGLVVSTTAGGMNVIHQAPPPGGAA